jgi:hypothetical protein
MATTTGQDWFNTIFGGLTTAAAQLIPAISNAANGTTTTYNPATGLPYVQQTNSTDTAILSQMAKDAAANKQTQTIALIGGAVLVAMMMFNKK